MKKKQVLVTVDRGETRVAILENSSNGSGGQARKRNRKPQSGSSPWRVSEIYIERPSSRSIVGNIYKGKVSNVIAGLEAAFVDIGMGKNGFLHVDEVITESSGKGRRSQPRRKITELLKPGQEIVVQAMKDPLKTKGARLTMQLAVPGRYMVYVPAGESIGVSRRLQDGERDRLRKIAAKLKIEKGGAIVRTAAHGARQEELAREISYLLKLQEVLDERIQSTPAPNLIFQEADLPIRVVRDLYSQEFDRAIIDEETQFNRVTNFLKRTAPELAGKVSLYSDREPLFEAYGVEGELRSTLTERVDLPSGGYLIIDYAEALTVIDVNTGSFTGRRSGGSLEETITRNNLEAADEVVRQLRLRDIGGIIVIDFIDMERTRNRTQVLSALNKFLDQDRTKTYVMEISPLGLVEMTRQNVTDGVREIMTDKCPICHGEGVVLSVDSMAIEVERRLHRLAEDSKDEAFLIQLNGGVAERLTGEENVLAIIEEKTGRVFYFEGSDALPVDTFSVIESGSKDTVGERALPFKKGEEVMLTLEEPHMYKASDAVAQLSGHTISVVDAVEYVGHKVLVRIEEVTRSTAHASLVADRGKVEPKVEPKPEPVKQAIETTVAEKTPEKVESPKSSGEPVTQKARPRSLRDRVKRHRRKKARS